METQEDLKLPPPTNLDTNYKRSKAFKHKEIQLTS